MRESSESRSESRAKREYRTVQLYRVVLSGAVLFQNTIVHTGSINFRQPPPDIVTIRATPSRYPHFSEYILEITTMQYLNYQDQYKFPAPFQDPHKSSTTVQNPSFRALQFSDSARLRFHSQDRPILKAPPPRATAEQLYVHLCRKVHTVKNKRCASTGRARGPFTEAAHDGQVRIPISDLTIVCGLAEPQQQAHSKCT